MIKRLVATILAVICLLHVAVTAYAHTKEGSNGHDQYMSWILFGSKTYKDTLPETSKEIKAIEALENAVALCIDQYNGSYEDELKELQAMRIHGLPDDISEINFRSNSHHRRYTHRGWNFSYPDDKGHWEIRKTILLQTVNKVFGFQRFAGKWRFVLVDKDYGYDKQCEAFSTLIYYIHILADIPDSGMDEGYSDMIKLAVANPSENNPDIYYELLRVLPIVFESQKTDPAYTGLISDIKIQANNARTFVRNTPDIKSKYSKYQDYAKDLIEKLASKIPSLLKREPFFKNVFFAEEEQK